MSDTQGPSLNTSNSAIVRVRGRSKTAQRCPICMGRGIMPSTFYQPIVGTASAIVDEQCRSCNGKGVVIVDD